MTAQTAQAHDAPLASPATAGGLTRSGALRLDAIDMLRGLVICLMVLDHVRDFFHAGSFDPLDLSQTSPALFATRWITHFCAPTFVFLSGVSAYLQHANGKPTPSLSRFLLTRGLWLIFLELTLINIGWQFVPALVFLQVIWAIGVSMVVLSALVWLPHRAVLALGVLIVAGHNLLDGITPESLGAAAPLWNLLHVTGVALVAGIPVLFAYPVLPWMGIMLLGYGLGGVFTKEQPARNRSLLLIGGGMFALFVLLRFLAVYGDPNAWQGHPELWKTVGDFIDVLKYPPSFLYVLVTIGLALMFIPLLEKLRGPPASVLLAFGRTPLFTYVLHIYIAHLLALATGVALGFPAQSLLNPFFVGAPDGWGFNLAITYGVWLLVLAILYPLAKWFEGVKRRRRDWWLGYL